MKTRSGAQKAMLAKLRSKGLGLAPHAKGYGPDRSVAQRRAAGAPVADLGSGRATLPLGGSKPADRRLGLQPDRDGLDLVTEFEIKVPGEWADVRISANDRDHHQAKGKLTKKWRLEGRAAARRAGMTDPLPWARIVIFYRFPDNIRRETSNLQPTSKAIVDGLVDVGLLPDDRDEHCDGPDNRRLWPNGPHKVVVQVWRRGLDMS